MDALQLTKVKQPAPAVIMFYISIACNMRLLARATVDTFIVIRSVAPILTQVGQCFLGADWPNRDAWLAFFNKHGRSRIRAQQPIANVRSRRAVLGVDVLCYASPGYVDCEARHHGHQAQALGLCYYNNLLALCVTHFGW